MSVPSPYVSRGGIKLEAALRAFGLDATGLLCADLGCNVGGFTDCLLRHGAARVYAVDTGYGTLAWKLRQDPRVVVLERTNAVHFDPKQPVAEVRFNRFHPHWWGQKRGFHRRSRTFTTGCKGLNGFGGCDLVALDLGWTRQSHALPAARRWLRIADCGLRIADVRSEGAAPELSPPVTEGPNATPAPSASVTSAIRNPQSHIPLIISLIKPHYEADRSLLRRGILDPADAQRVAQRVLAEMPAHAMRVLAHIRSPIFGGAGKGKAGNVEYLALLAPM